MPAAQYFHHLVNEIGNRNVLIDGELDFILPVVVESVADFRPSSPIGSKYLCKCCPRTEHTVSIQEALS